MSDEAGFGWRNILHQRPERTTIELLTLFPPFWALKMLWYGAVFPLIPTPFELWLVLTAVAVTYYASVRIKMDCWIKPAVVARSWAAWRIIVAVSWLPILVINAVAAGAPFLHRGLWWGVFISSLIPIWVILIWHLLPLKSHQQLVPAKAIALALSTLLAIGLTEAVIYSWFGPFPKGMPSVSTPDKRYWYYRPNSIGWLNGIEHRFNAWGFRGPGPDENPYEDSLRVLVIGDSIPFGGGIPEQEVFPWKAQELINSGQRLDRPVFVMNASIPGYSTEQIRCFYREHLEKIDHDIVIYCHYIDDVNRESHYKRHDLLYSPTWPVRTQTLYYHWSGLRLLLHGLGLRDSDFFRHRRFIYDHSFDYAMGVIEQLAWHVKSNGRQFAVVNIPNLDWDGRLNSPSEYRHLGFHNQVARSCEQKGIAYCDALPLLIKRDISEYRISDRDRHFNQQGHAEMAVLLSDFIVGGALDAGLAESPTSKVGRRATSGPRSATAVGLPSID